MKTYQDYRSITRTTSRWGRSIVPALCVLFAVSLAFDVNGVSGIPRGLALVTVPVAAIAWYLFPMFVPPVVLRAAYHPTTDNVALELDGRVFRFQRGRIAHVLYDYPDSDADPHLYVVTKDEIREEIPMNIQGITAFMRTFAKWLDVPEVENGTVSSLVSAVEYEQ